MAFAPILLRWFLMLHLRNLNFTLVEKSGTTKTYHVNLPAYCQSIWNLIINIIEASSWFLSCSLKIKKHCTNVNVLVAKQNAVLAFLRTLRTPSKTAKDLDK